jgi:hypothetical protein
MIVETTRMLRKTPLAAIACSACSCALGTAD